MSSEDHDSDVTLDHWLHWLGEQDDESLSTTAAEQTTPPVEETRPVRALRQVPSDDAPTDLSDDDDEDDVDVEQDQEAVPETWDDLLGTLAQPAGQDSDDTVGTTPAVSQGPAPALPRRKDTPARRRWSRAERPASPVVKSPRPEPPRTWLKAGAATVLVTGLVAVAAVVGRSMMDEQTPVTAATVTQETLTPTTPTIDAVEVADAPPSADTPTFAGHCSADQAGDAQRVRPGRDDLRATLAAFQEAYFAHDIDGVRAVINDSNRNWKNQDWKKVFDSLPANVTWCLQMPALDPGSSSMTVTLTMSSLGEKAAVYKQLVRGTSTDGVWTIRQITRA